MSKHVPRDTEVQTPKRAVLPPEMIEVALPNRIEPLAGSLDLPEGPTVAGHADRVRHCLGGRGGDGTGGGLDVAVRADARVVQPVAPLADEPIVGTDEARLHQILEPDPVASALPVAAGPGAPGGASPNA